MNRYLKTLLIFSGGGLPGIDIHAGIGLALSEAGIIPDEIHGTSAGAIYGALFAAHRYSGIPPVNIIYDLLDDDVRDTRFLYRSRFRFINHMMRGRKMAALIGKHLPETFEELPGRLFVYAVEGGSGRLVPFTGGSLRRSVRASASIRGMFPPVPFEMPEYTKYYSDGGTKANIPLPPYWREFDKVIIAVATQPVNYRGSGLIYNALLSVHELMESQVDHILAETQGDPRVIILRPPVDGKTGTMRFNHDLIDVAYRYAKQELNHDRPL
jgi:predicted acylesterase/phospholipase RssA